jgi:S-adenosylmethionine hydrolase
MASRPTSRIITLLTDFGLADHFVGVMKGVIAGIAPRARVIDISHQVEPYQLEQARFLLAQSWPWFPQGTIHIAVVDPGVGSTRRPLLVQAAGHSFIGPDNGIFSNLLGLPGGRARELTNRKLFLKPVSATFHGRDIFAPCAAHLAAGLAPARLGPLVKDALRSTLDAPQRTGKRIWTGVVVHIDRFGNLITNLPAAEFPELATRPFSLSVGMVTFESLTPNYAAAAPGEPLLLVGSSGNLEVACNQASAAQRLGCGAGAPVELVLY